MKEFEFNRDVYLFIFDISFSNYIFAVMPRIARIIIPDIPHHITQRGNNRQDVFFTDDDKVVYLGILKAQADNFGLLIDGYCLMTNHIHLITTPHKEDSLAKAMGRTNLLYSQYINRLHKRGGHLWQNRYFSNVLGQRYFFNALRYIERNPVRAGICRRAWNYPWSSASAHVNGSSDAYGLIDAGRWKELSGSMDWKEVLQGRESEADITKMRAYCRTGRPLGSDSFISKLESKLGRRLRALPVGRPAKNKKAKISDRKTGQRKGHKNDDRNR